MSNYSENQIGAHYTKVWSLPGEASAWKCIETNDIELHSDDFQEHDTIHCGFRASLMCEVNSAEEADIIWVEFMAEV